MKQIDAMVRMTEITDLKDIPVAGADGKRDGGMIIKPKILHRSHIKKRLEGIFATPLFFVVSGMGTGKTTAVRDFLKKKRKIKYIWFSFEKQMTEDIWLWVRFCKTVEKTNVQLGRRMLKYGIPQSSRDMERFISSISNVMETETVVVLDDVHMCESRFLKSIMEKIAASAIPMLHIVMISRTEPLPDAQQLVEQGKANSITARTFEFSKVECEDFFILNDAPLNDREVDLLYEKTQGRASELYLALMHHMNGQSLDTMESGRELMKSAFYNGLDESTKRSLLILSKVKSFTLDQAEFITKDRSIRSTIKRFYEYNCFTKYDEEEGTYSFHAILTDFLSSIFDSSSLDENEIYELQGDWHLAVGERIKAISAYTSCGDNRRILEIMSEPASVKLMAMAPSIIRNAFDRMSMFERFSNPIAYLTYIYSYSTIIDVKEGMRLLADAKAYYEKVRELEDKNQIMGEIALIESIGAFNDIKSMFKCYERAHNFFDGGTSRIFNADVVITFGVPLTMFLYHKEQGDMKKIVELVEDQFWIFNHIANGCGAGFEHLIRAEYEYMQGNFETAEMRAYKAIYKAETKKQTGIILSASFLLLRMALFSGKPRDVNEILMRMMDAVEAEASPTMTACYEFILGYVFSYMGKPDMIPKWLMEGDPEKAHLMAPARDTAYLIMGKIACESGDYERLENISRKMEEIYTTKKNLIGVMIGKVYRSIATYHRKGVHEAAYLMKEALSLAEADGCYVTLAENTNEIIAILEVTGTQTARDVKTLAENYLESREIFRQSGKPANQLTKREREVMDLVCDGYTAEAIGRILFVSMSTVKKHTAAAYEKLGVNKKADAIAAYRKLTKK